MDRTIKLTPAEAVDLLHQKDTRITELEAEVERLLEWQRKSFDAHPNIDMDIEFVEGKDENPR